MSPSSIGAPVSISPDCTAVCGRVNALIANALRRPSGLAFVNPRKSGTPRFAPDVAQPSAPGSTSTDNTAGGWCLRRLTSSPDALPLLPWWVLAECKVGRVFKTHPFLATVPRCPHWPGDRDLIVGPRTERLKGMTFSSWSRLRGRKQKRARAERCGATRSHTFRPRLEVLESRELPSAAVIIVHPGESIQAAVDAARPGTVINIEAGTYLQNVSVAKPGIQLIGLDGPGGVL